MSLHCNDPITNLHDQIIPINKIVCRTQQETYYYNNNNYTQSRQSREVECRQIITLLFGKPEGKETASDKQENTTNSLKNPKFQENVIKNLEPLNPIS